MKIRKIMMMPLLFSIVLIACSIFSPRLTPTSTEMPSETPMPTSTSTEIPSKTLLPTSTPDPSPTFTTVPTSTSSTEPTVSEQNNSTGKCIISTDSTYGYTQGNPIKVGGGDFGGPPRERAFLDNLLGPNGEKITYELTESFNFGDTILDTFEITSLQNKVTLYIDEYSYTEPQAPLGFTCLSNFPLTAP